jgi:manganese/zinc/iron transport system substrate-binding protein
MKKIVRNIGFRVLSGIPLVFLLMSCEDRQPQTPSTKLRVVATTGMIADAVRNISGDRIELATLMGPGVDPHLYKATHGDVKRITEADILFYNGLHLEGKMGSLFEKAGKTRAVVAVTRDVPVQYLRPLEGTSSYDPHIWFDIMLWQNAVKTITKTLQEHDSLHAAEYEANFQRYIVRLDSLHQAVKQQVSSLPSTQRVLITAHDAFGYFGDAYGIEVRGLQGISTLSEFGLRDVTQLVNFIIDRKIRAIFAETSVSDRSINAIIEGCRNRGWEVAPGGSLYSDALGDRGTPEGTYIGMIDKNVQMIVNALK